MQICLENPLQTCTVPVQKVASLSAGRSWVKRGPGFRSLVEALPGKGIIVEQRGVFHFLGCLWLNQQAPSALKA